ncbi:MAG: endolytic transglycosylase MltG [Nitrospirota bacterium]|nr:endolytic transglycosylase MltG [Nitrospirota bacterium]
MKHKYLWISVALAFLGSLYLYVQTFTPPTGPRQDKEIEFPENAAFREVAAKLEHEGLIRNAWIFTQLARWKKIDRNVRAGTYALNSSMTPEKIISIFREGRIIEIPITFPEGLSAAQVGMLLERHGLLTAEKFRAMIDDPALVATFKVEGPTLEGYLFPDTYLFPKGMKPLEIIRKMVRRYKEIYTPELAERAKAIGLSEREIITIASIVEKEVLTEFERPIVAAVCYNRLKIGMPLQSDPTVIYALGDRFTGKLKRKDMVYDSPYNTYRYKGLPPGPIANPGKASIIAALYPAKTKYLYFVSKKDGTHYFSKTYNEHSAAVRKYLIQGKNGKQG